jgi:hypothetical protein
MADGVTNDIIERNLELIKSIPLDRLQESLKIIFDNPDLPDYAHDLGQAFVLMEAYKMSLIPVRQPNDKYLWLAVPVEASVTGDTIRMGVNQIIGFQAENPCESICKVALAMEMIKDIGGSDTINPETIP